MCKITKYRYDLKIYNIVQISNAIHTSCLYNNINEKYYS